MREEIESQGARRPHEAVEPFGEFVKKEIQRWAKIVKDAGVKPQ